MERQRNVIDKMLEDFFTEKVYSKLEFEFGDGIYEFKSKIDDIIVDVFNNFETEAVKRLDEIIAKNILSADEEIEAIDKSIIDEEKEKIEEVIKRVEKLMYE